VKEKEKMWSYPCGRPWRSRGFRDVDPPHFLDGGEVVSPTRQQTALYPTGRFLILISVRGLVDPRAILRLEKKNPKTLSVMEPATFGLVAYWLNKLRYRVPQVVKQSLNNSVWILSTRGDETEENCVLGCDATQSGRYASMFWRTVSIFRMGE
jgi:hypothetical protein